MCIRECDISFDTKCKRREFCARTTEESRINCRDVDWYEHFKLPYIISITNRATNSKQLKVSSIVAV